MAQQSQGRYGVYPRDRIVERKMQFGRRSNDDNKSRGGHCNVNEYWAVNKSDTNDRDSDLLYSTAVL